MNHFTKNSPALTGACILALLTACGQQSDNSVPSPEALTILCGSSFVPPTEKLIETFKKETGADVTYTVAGSEDFLPQVQMEAIGDLLITHDPFLDHVRDAGKLLGSHEVGFVAPVVAVKPGNPKGIKTIEDLAKPGLKVALTDPKYSTCGEMIFALLETKGIKDAVLANVGNRLTKGHSDLGNFLKLDAVDAVVMWNGVAHTFEGDVEIVPTVYEYDSEIRVHVMGLNYSKQPDLVQRFLAHIGAHGKAVFQQEGYVKYEPK